MLDKFYRDHVLIPVARRSSKEVFLQCSARALAFVHLLSDFLPFHHHRARATMDTNTNKIDSTTVRKYTRPPHNFAILEFVGLDLSAVIRCGHACITVKATESDLLPQDHADSSDSKITSCQRSLHSEYLSHAANKRYPKAELMRWIGGPLVSLMEKAHLEAMSDNSELLSKHLDTEFYAMRLYNVDDELVARPCERDFALERRLFRAPPPVTQVDLQHYCEVVPLFQTSELVIDFHGRNSDFRFIVPPTRVHSLQKPDVCMAFKQFQDDKSFRREIHTLVQLRNHHDRETLFIPDILGIVVSDGMMVGFLTAFVDYTCTLGARRSGKLSDVTPDIRKQWKQQIDTAVCALHECGLTWGDVKPDNVLISKDLNAWVIDFGGGYSRPFTARTSSGTVLGDIEAVEKLKRDIDCPGCGDEDANAMRRLAGP